MLQFQFTPLAAIRESLRTTLRQFLLFIFFGTAISAIVNSKAIEYYILVDGEVMAGIVFMVFFGVIFGVPLWVAFRVLRFAAGR